MNEQLLLNAFICSTGLALHIAAKWAEARAAVKDNKPGFVAYLKQVPAKPAVAVLTTVGVFSVTAAMEWMNPGMAFASGYMGNSMAANLADRFSKTP